jgi:LPS-assembly lipoprotein
MMPSWFGLIARRVCLAGLVLLLAGCGFQLRGAYSLPYESIYVGNGGQRDRCRVEAADPQSAGTRIAESKDDAQATFLPVR